MRKWRPELDWRYPGLDIHRNCRLILLDLEAQRDSVMPRKTIQVCTRCGKLRCDGGVWKIVKVVRLADGSDATRDVYPDNLVDCMGHWGLRNFLGSTPRSVGTEIDKEFKNWVCPSVVTLRKIED